MTVTLLVALACPQCAATQRSGAADTLALAALLLAPFLVAGIAYGVLRRLAR